MRAVVQRVAEASVQIKGEKSAAVSQGLLVLVGIEDADSEQDADWLSAKIVRLRIFDDQQGVMNLSIKDIGGEILVVSQFTLHASLRKGNRPSYKRASGPEKAIPLYEYFVSKLKEELGRDIPTGVFGAEMQVSLTNDGPVTILIDTKEKD